MDGHSGKGTAAGLGALKGGGTGFAWGTLSCMGAALLAPACFAIVVPTMTAVGAAGWSTVAAVTSESADVVEFKLHLLQSNVPANLHDPALAMDLHGAVLERFGIDLPVKGEPARSGSNANQAQEPIARPWLIEVALTDVAFEDNIPDQPYALRVQGRMRLIRAEGADAVYEKRLAVRSSAAHTTDEWSANGALAIKGNLDQSLRQLAQEMLSDLMTRPPDALKP